MATRPIVNSISVTDTPTTLQRKTEYNSDGLALYIGYAPMGASADDENAWTIYTFEYNANLQETAKKTAITSWTNRASATYA